MLSRNRKQIIASIIVLLTFRPDSVISQEPGFVGQLLPPDFIMQHRAEIQLSDAQLQQIEGIAREFREKAESPQQLTAKHNQELTKLLESEEKEEAAVLAKLKSYLAAEQELKQLHFTAMFRIRNVLTAKQRGQLIAKRKSLQSAEPNSIAAGRSPNEDERRLRGKVERIRKEVQKRATSGAPPVEAAKLMREFSETMKQGRVDEAEAILDRVMKMLDLEPKDKSQPRPQTKDGAMLPQKPKAVTRLVQKPQLSYAAIRKSVRDLHVEDVAWRQIEWETCLLNGLQRSRSERKPLVLWVFIDRPIDDERC